MTNQLVAVVADNRPGFVDALRRVSDRTGARRVPPTTKESTAALATSAALARSARWC